MLNLRYDGVPGTYVDIVRDVINIVSVHWAADRLVGHVDQESRTEMTFSQQCGLPLKTKDNPRGLYTEQEVYDMFSTLVIRAVFACLWTVLTSI